MASISDSSSLSSSKFFCFYGMEWRSLTTTRTLVWYAINLIDNKSKRKRDASDSDRLLKLPVFNTIIRPKIDVNLVTVSLGSKIYCLIFGGRRLLCLDTSHPEIGWTEIYSPMLNYNRTYPLTAVADGKIYVMGGRIPIKPWAKDLPWAEVFDPCTEKWYALNPHPVRDFRFCGDYIHYFAGSLALDDDGAGVSRKVIILASYESPEIHVYDVETKSWVVPLPPKLESSFFFSKFRGLTPPLRCKPVVVGKTVYWYAVPDCCVCAYDVETGEFSLGYFEGLEQMVEYLPNEHIPYMFLLHLGESRFCLIWLDILLVFNFSKGHQVLDYHPMKPTGATICLEYVRRFFARSPASKGFYVDPGFILMGAMFLDGKLEASKLRRVVNFLPPTLAELGAKVDHLDFKIMTKQGAELEGSESKFVPISRFTAVQKSAC